MKKILVATRNEGKLQELTNFLSDLPIKIVSLSQVGIYDEVEETGETYQDNSQKKARFYAKISGLPTIADDGGIEIEALNWGPGIKSRRFFGKDGKEATDEEIIKNVKLLLRKTPANGRRARFRTVVTLALPSGKTFSATGVIHGLLKESYLKLLKGYPYRSFFYIPKLNKYYHENELTPEEQKRYNHRYKAIQKLKPIIQKVLDL